MISSSAFAIRLLQVSFTQVNPCFASTPHGRGQAFLLAIFINYLLSFSFFYVKMTMAFQNPCLEVPL